MKGDFRGRAWKNGGVTSGTAVTGVFSGPGFGKQCGVSRLFRAGLREVERGLVTLGGPGGGIEV